MANPFSSKHSLLDPAKATRELNAAWGSTVITRFGELDPTLAEKQMNAKVGTAVFHKTGPKDRGLSDPAWTTDSLSHALGFS
jgi:hypothetical protein